MPTEPNTLEEWVALETPENVKPFHCNEYPRHKVAELAQNYEITSLDEVDGLWGTLETAGANYTTQIALEATHNSNANRKKKLKALERRLSNLCADISAFVEGDEKDIQLNSLVRSTDLRTALLLISEDAPEAVVNASAKTQDNSRTVPSLADVVHHLRYAEFVFENARNQIPKAKSGRKENAALKHWIDQLGRFWTGTLGRQVTVEFHTDSSSGLRAPLTEFSRFMVACFQPVATEADLSSLPTQLSEYRTEKNSEKN